LDTSNIDYLSYISYTYSDVNERYFPDLTSAAVKVKFTDKNQTENLPDTISITDIKYSTIDNNIRLTGLKQNNHTVTTISNEYSYIHRELLDLKNVVQFDEMPTLMGTKNGIQLFSDKNYVLTRTKESVIITPNSDIIRIEDTNAQMDEDLRVCGSVDIRGNTRIYNTLDILEDINVSNNILVNNSLRVNNTIKTNNIQISDLTENNIPYAGKFGVIKQSKNFKWNSEKNQLQINSTLQNSDLSDISNNSGLLVKGNILNNGNIINTGDIVTQNNNYNMQNVFIGGTLHAGSKIFSAYENANQLIENKEDIDNKLNDNNYDTDLIDTSKYDSIHTIQNKPLYIGDSTYISSTLDIINKTARVDDTITNRLSKNNTTITITGDSKIFNGDLNIVGNNTAKLGNISETPNEITTELSSGYALNSVINSGNINADGMLRVGLHYNLYDRLTKNLDFKTVKIESENIPINLEENKDNIEYLKGNKDKNSYYSAANLISGRFNDIYGNTLIERRHSDLIFPMDNKPNTKKISLELGVDSDNISVSNIKETSVTTNNKSLSRIHSYIGWKENAVHNLKSSVFKEAPHEFVRLKGNDINKNFALDISDNNVEGKLDLFAQTVSIGGNDRNSSLIEEHPVDNIRQYFSKENTSELYCSIGSGLIINKKPETGVGFPSGEITIRFILIKRLCFMRPKITAIVNELGNIIIDVKNPGKGYKSIDDISYIVKFKADTGVEFEYTRDDLLNNTVEDKIPITLKGLIPFELEFKLDRMVE